MLELSSIKLKVIINIFRMFRKLEVRLNMLNGDMKNINTQIGSMEVKSHNFRGEKYAI